MRFKSFIKVCIKEIQIIPRLSLCTFKPVKFNQSLNLLRCQLAGKEVQVYAVGSNSLETTYHTRAIISPSLYIFYTIFEDHFFVFKEDFSENSVLVYGQYSRTGYDGARMVYYLIFCHRISCKKLKKIEPTFRIGRNRSRIVGSSQRSS